MYIWDYVWNVILRLFFVSLGTVSISIFSLSLGYLFSLSVSIFFSCFHIYSMKNFVLFFFLSSKICFLVETPSNISLIVFFCLCFAFSKNIFTMFYRNLSYYLTNRSKDKSIVCCVNTSFFARKRLDRVRCS